MRSSKSLELNLSQANIAFNNLKAFKLMILNECQLQARRTRAKKLLSRHKWDAQKVGER